MTARSSRSARSATPQPSSKLLAWQPRQGLLAAAIACLVARVMIPSESAVEDVAGTFFALAWMLIAALTALDGWRNRSVSWRPSGSELALFALAAWYGVAALVAIPNGTARPAINSAWMWFSYAAAYGSLRRLVQHEAERRALVAVMASLAFAVSLFGLEQFAVEMPATRAAYHADPERALRDAGLGISAEPGSRERMLFEQRLESSEPFATFALTNSLAGFLTPWLLIAGFVAWQGFFSRADSQRFWMGPLVTCVPIAACLLLTKSRSAYVAVAFGAAMGFLMQPAARARLKPRWIMAGTGVVALLIALGAAVGALDREIVTEAGKSLGYRGQYWQASVEMLADHPLFGVGPGQFQTVYTQYKSPTASEVVADPHNFLLEVAAAAGAPALLLLLAFGAFAFMEWRASIGASTTEDVGAAPATLWMIAGGLLGLLIAFPVGFLAYSPPSLMAFVVVIPSMLVGLAMWHAWGNRGQLDRQLPLVGAAALLVNLLAAGGIGFPAVAGTLWALLALSARPARVTSDAPNDRYAWYPALWMGAMSVALVAAYWTAFRPMTAALTARQSAVESPRFAERDLEAAVAADPYSVTPSRELAAWRYARWQAEPTAENWRAVAAALEEELQRAPQSAIGWQHAGGLYLEAYRRLGDEASLRAATDHLERAVELFTNSSAAHADLAEALDLAKDEPPAREHARLALKLDDVTPHLDLKLSEARRAEMERIARGESASE